MTRAMMSVVPPGAKPTTIRIGLAGQAGVWAWTPAMPSVQKVAAAAWTRRRINWLGEVNMVCLLAAVMVCAGKG